MSNQQGSIGKEGQVLVLGLNQTIDRTISVERMVPGAVVRAHSVAVTGGGKAVNVARTATNLQHPCTLIATFPGQTGRYALGLLEAEGLHIDAVPTPGEIRSTLIAIGADGEATVVNEPGPTLDRSSWRAAFDRLATHLDSTNGKAPPIVVSGSLPPGAPVDAHRHIVALAHRHGSICAVDCAGEALTIALEAGADIVSPNLAEAAALLSNVEGDVELVEADGAEVADRAVAAAHALTDRGARSAVVSAGRHGAAYVSSGDEAWIAAPSVEVDNPIGAGDSLLGGLVVSLAQGRRPVEAVRRGVAYAAASVACPVGGYADLDVYERLVGEVES